MGSLHFLRLYDSLRCQPRLWLAALCLLSLPAVAHAQGAPPLLTNDPGTPGNGNWEINLGAMPVLRQNQNFYQVPQIDINFGLGDRIQLTYEVPYAVQTAPGHPSSAEWSNTFAGVKWRFLEKWHGWDFSTFPQVGFPGLGNAVKSGIAISGTKLLVPLEITKSVGPLNLGFEAGYYFPWHAHGERIIGFTAGHDVTPNLEVGSEIYNDYVMGALPKDTTFDFGGRYKFHEGLIFLFMAGRSFSGNSTGQPEFMAYTGVQILLQKYGKELRSDP